MTLNRIVKIGQFTGLDGLSQEDFQREILRRLAGMEADLNTQVDLISDELDNKVDVAD